MKRLTAHLAARHTPAIVLRFATLTALGVLAAVLFAAAMTEGLNYDEEQYVGGAYFVRTLSAYRDFVSLQPPVYTWVVGAAFRLSDGWYLLVARTVTWVFAVGSCLLLYSLLRTTGAGRPASFLLLLGFVTSPFVREPLTNTRNDVMPLFLLLAGLRVGIRSDGCISASALRILSSGLFVTLAVSTKFSYLFGAPILAFALLHSGTLDRSSPRTLGVRRVGWFLTGSALGALPLAYCLAIDPERFFACTVSYHLQAMPSWYRSQGYGDILTLKHELTSFLSRMTESGNAALLFVFISALLALVARGPWGLGRRLLCDSRVLALAALFAAAMLTAILTGPHAMYYAPPAALGTLLTGCVYAAARPGLPRWLGGAVLAVALLLTTPALQDYRWRVSRSRDLNRWVGIQTHRSALRIAAMLEERGVTGHVATLFPVLVLDANVVLPQFASGPFLFRSAYFYGARRVAWLHAAGPATLDSLFAAAPPAAIVAGFGPFPFKWNPPMDAALTDFARRAGYICVADDWSVGGYRNGQVWIRPPTVVPVPAAK